MSKSQINNLSKRQILESLYYEQSQSTATLSRFFTAIARIQNITPEDLAKAFAEDQANQEYVQKFNENLRALQEAKNATAGIIASTENQTSDDNTAADQVETESVQTEEETKE